MNDEALLGVEEHPYNSLEFRSSEEESYVHAFQELIDNSVNHTYSCSTESIFVCSLVCVCGASGDVFGVVDCVRCVSWGKC